MSPSARSDYSSYGDYGAHGGHDTYRAHRPPRDCPVCGAGLTTTRLGCGSCGSELSGVFEGCAFCALSDADRSLLQVFLVSRGNLREVERHLGVSYPTARQRYAELLVKLGLEPHGDERGTGEKRSATGGGGSAPAEPQLSRSEILSQLASGDLDVDTASDLLRAAP